MVIDFDQFVRLGNHLFGRERIRCHFSRNGFHVGNGLQDFGDAVFELDAFLGYQGRVGCHPGQDADFMGLFDVFQIGCVYKKLHRKSLQFVKYRFEISGRKARSSPVI
ncbi:hypothetical protein D3C81_1900060 [compost metagenome]